MAELIDENVSNSEASRPSPRSAGSLRRWFKKRDPVTSSPGTTYDETFVNDLLGNLYHILDQGGVTHTLGSGGDPDILTALGNIFGFPVGTTIDGYFAAAPSSAWLLMDDGTLGDTGSGADHAGSAYQTLYEHLWDTCADAQCPVSTGRGASASADWAAGKTLRMPLTMGRVYGNAGAGSGLTSRVIGEDTGAEAQALAAHTHDLQTSNTAAAGTGAQEPATTSQGVNGSPTQDVMQPTAFRRTIIKL